MVLHNFDGAHILMADAVCGYAVFAAEKVGALYIEFVLSSP